MIVIEPSDLLIHFSDKETRAQRAQEATDCQRLASKTVAGFSCPSALLPWPPASLTMFTVHLESQVAHVGERQIHKIPLGMWHIL